MITLFIAAHENTAFKVLPLLIVIFRRAKSCFQGARLEMKVTSVSIATNKNLDPYIIL